MKASGEEQRGGGTAPVVVAVFLPCRAVIAFVALPEHLVACTGTLFSLRLSFSREERYAPSPRAVHREKDALRVLSPLRELTLAAVFAVPVEYLETLARGLFTVPLHLEEGPGMHLVRRERGGPASLPSSRAAARRGGVRDADSALAAAGARPRSRLRRAAAPGDAAPGPLHRAAAFVGEVRKFFDPVVDVTVPMLCLLRVPPHFEEGPAKPLSPLREP